MILLLLLSSLISSRHPTYCSRLVALKNTLCFPDYYLIIKLPSDLNCWGYNLILEKTFSPLGKKIAVNYFFAKKVIWSPDLGEVLFAYPAIPPEAHRG